MIISQTKTPFLGVVFNGDHDFEGPRSLKAHLDTVKYKPTAPHGPPPYLDYSHFLLAANTQWSLARLCSGLAGHVLTLPSEARPGPKRELHFTFRFRHAEGRDSVVIGTPPRLWYIEAGEGSWRVSRRSGPSECGC